MRRELPISWPAGILVACAVGFMTAVVMALLLGLADIYATGHGWRTISGPWLDWPALGIHLSPADVVLLAAAAMASGIAWRRLQRRSP